MSKALIIIGATRNQISSDISEYDFVLTFDKKTPVSNSNYHEIKNLIVKVTDISVAKRCNCWAIVNAGGEQLKEISDEIKAEVSKIQYSWIVMYKTAIGTAEQTLANISVISQSNGIDVLKGKLKGKPVLIVSGGPSLEKQIETIKEYQNRITIIAIAQTLPVLLSNDIQPDFVCGIDWTESYVFHYKYLPKTTILIASTAINRSILKRWNGPIVFTSSLSSDYSHELHKNTVFSIIDKKIGLERGGSVAHTAISVARYMEASPIVLVGQDCALGECGFTHCVQSITTNKWKIDQQGNMSCVKQAPRQSSVPPKRKIFAGGPEKIINTNGYYGNDVKATPGLTSFRLTIESMIKKNSLFVINATEGGAMINGAVNRPLKKAFEKYGNIKQEINVSLKQHDDTELALKLAKSDKEKMNDIKKYINIVKRTNIEIRKLQKDSKKYVQRAKKNSKYTLLLNNTCKTIPYMRMILMIGITKCKFEEKSIDKNLKLVNFIEKYFNILDEAYNIAILELSGADISNKKYGWQYDHALLDKFDISDAGEYFKYGNYSVPMLEARAILKDDQSNMLAKSVLTRAIDMRRSRIMAFNKESKTE